MLLVLTLFLYIEFSYHSLSLAGLRDITEWSSENIDGIHILAAQKLAMLTSSFVVTVKPSKRYLQRKGTM